VANAAQLLSQNAKQQPFRQLRPPKIFVQEYQF
jgi:hypothetical protein